MQKEGDGNGRLHSDPFGWSSVGFGRKSVFLFVFDEPFTPLGLRES